MTAATPSALQTWLVRARGRVQGVGFREACVRQARRIGVTGWVRNRLDDSVELTLQGPPDRLAELCAWLREGDHPALVDSLDVDEVPAPFPRFDRFERLPTV
jgi:acylphosphatase